MLKSSSFMFAASITMVMTAGYQPAGAVPLGGIALQVVEAEAGTSAGMVIRAGSGKKAKRSRHRALGADDRSLRGHYFTREKIVKDYYNGQIPPARVEGPVIYTYRWFDNAYGGRR